MRKKILFVLALIVFGYIQAANAQIINQDASGTSSIVTPGSAINLNITQTQIQGSQYGLFGGSKKGVYGFDLAGNNSTGVASLFDNGKFSPGASIDGLIGFRITWLNKNDATLSAQYQQVNDLRASKSADFVRDYEAEVVKDVNANAVLKAHPADLKSVGGDLIALDQNLYNLSDQLKQYTSKSITDATEIAAVKDIVNQITTFVNGQNILTEIVALDDRKNALNYPNMVRNSTAIFYFRGGYSANQFTYDQGGAITDYAKRFMDTTGKTWFIQVGSTYQFKQNFLGLNFGYSHQNNMSSLTSADYTYSYQDTTVTTGKLTKQKSFTAYSGKYGYYGSIDVNIDFQHLFTVDTSKYIGLGPYLRWSHNLNANGLAKDATVLGVSLNYLNGKSGAFLGGVYLQSDDISGHTQPQFSKSIQFGLIAKFSLGTIFIQK